MSTNPVLLTPEQQNVLCMLETDTYDEIRQKTGWSRGKIYGLALRHGARKYEDRIQHRVLERERQQEQQRRTDERRQRQIEALEEIVNSTCKADVLDFLSGIPDDSVALHFTSPPYNLGKAYGGSPEADTMRFTYYHGWLMQVISEMARTVKPGGVVCMNVGKTRDENGNLMPLDWLIGEDLTKSGLTFQSRPAWPVPHGLTPTHRLAERYETILVFSKGEQVSFNPNSCRIPQKDPGKRAFKGPNKGRLSGNPLGAFPTDVWSDIGNVGHNHPEAREGRHPAQFPVALPKKAILLYTQPGDIVCDCFSGSGSTAVAAIEAGRCFIGADLYYEDLRERRITAARPDTFSPLTGVTDASIAVWQAEARRVERTPEVPLTCEEDRELCGQLGLF